MSIVHIPADEVELDGELILPPSTKGVVAFAHGSGSSRFSPRNTYVAEVLQQQNIGTLLFDLLTREEDRDYETRFDIALLTRRLLAATEWLQSNPSTQKLKLGYFGASTGAAAALQAAAQMGDQVAAVVSRGGRPDLAGEAALSRVTAPTLLIVGAADYGVIELNQQAHALMHCKKQLSLMNFCPCFHKPSLPLRQAASDEFDRIDREDPDVVLIIGMEVRAMVRRRGLGEHADDDPEESGDLWHLSRLLVSQTSIAMLLFESTADVQLTNISLSVTNCAGPSRQPGVARKEKASIPDVVCPPAGDRQSPDRGWDRCRSRVYHTSWASRATG